MCGIIGGINTLSSQQVSEKLKVLAHRGPDDSGVYAQGNVSLGHTRLSIIDTSSCGHQPMTTSDEHHTIVFNGEIYNHEAIRKELQPYGYTYSGSSDTETLLYAYKTWGASCLEKLNGIFAFAVHDAEKKSLFVARDPMGVKPLYYYKKGNQLVFSSELKALLHIPSLDYSLQPEILFNYTTLLWSPGTETPFKHIKKLWPGQCLDIQLDNVAKAEPTRYYQIPFDGSYDNLSKQDWIDRTEALLQTALMRQQLADVPIGYFLSGGIDSSLLVAMAAQKNNQLNTYTIDTGGSMRQEGFGDDLHYAMSIGRQLGLTPTVIPATADMLAQLDDLVWHLDEPTADPAAIHVHSIAQAASHRGIKVLISGTGADEVFSGYRRHQALGIQQYSRLLPASLLKKTTGSHTTIKRRIAKLIPPAGFRNPYLSSYYWLDPHLAKSLFLPEIQARIQTNWYEQYVHMLNTQIPQEQNSLNRMLYWDMHGFLPDHNLNYTDKMAMAAGVEARVPYLDIEMVAMGARIPPSLKMKGLTTKYLLREVAKRHLPQEIITRKKTGFAAPVRQWIKTDKKDWVKNQLLDDSVYKHGMFERTAVANLLALNEAGKVDASYTLLSLLCINSWLRQFT